MVSLRREDGHGPGGKEEEESVRPFGCDSGFSVVLYGQCLLKFPIASIHQCLSNYCLLLYIVSAIIRTGD